MVSRAYYAAILVVRDRAGMSIHTKDVHRDTCNHYLNAADRKLWPIGNCLDELRLSGNGFDYDLKRTVSKLDASEALKKSRKVPAGL